MDTGAINLMKYGIMPLKPILTDSLKTNRILNNIEKIVQSMEFTKTYATYEKKLNKKKGNKDEEKN